MKTLKLLLCLSLLAVAVPLSAYTVTGHAYYHASYDRWFYANQGTNIKFCIDNGTAAAYQGNSQCYYTTSGPSGYPSYGSYSIDLPGGYTYYWFIWNDSIDWGSPSTPAWSAPNGTRVNRITIPYGPVYGFEIYSDPRPHAPSAVYPSNGATNVPQSFTLKWSSGIDYDRNWPGVWTATYDVYAYGNGGVENLVIANAPCNADASGNCTYAISNLTSSAQFYWRVVAKLNTGTSVPANPYYTTNGPSASFTTTTNPYGTYSFVAANSYHRLSATNCGGYDMNARGTSNGPCESFRIIDLNGGDLNNGDQVYLQLNGYYVSAENGGGSAVSVNRGSAGTWETFTIEKRSGSAGSRILNSDRVSFRTVYGYYISAENGGGGNVNAYPTYPSYYETFAFGSNN